MRIKIETGHQSVGAIDRLRLFNMNISASTLLQTAGSILPKVNVGVRRLSKLTLPLLIALFGMTGAAIAQDTPYSNNCDFYGWGVTGPNDPNSTDCLSDVGPDTVKVYSTTQFPPFDPPRYDKDGNLITKPFYGYIEEGETIQFVFGISVGKLTAPLEVKLKVTRNAGKENSETTYDSVTLNPSPSGEGGKPLYLPVATLDITAEDDCEVEYDGNIVVRILPDGQNGKLYVEDEYNNNEVVTVKDNDAYPTLLIAPVSYNDEFGYAVVEGEYAVFKILIADSPHCEDIAVSLGISFRGAFSDEPIQQINFTFEADRHSQDLMIRTLDNDESELNGSVTVAIGKSDSYNIATGEDTATIAIVDDDSAVLSVAPAGKWSRDYGHYVNEGETAKFTIETLSIAPVTDITVNVRIELFGDFFPDTRVQRKIQFKAKEYYKDFSIETEVKSGRQVDGAVVATIEAGGGYTLAPSPRHSASVRIVDSEPKPRLSITSTSAGSIYEGEQVVFTIESSMPLPDMELPVIVQISQIEGGQEVVTNQTVVLARNETMKSFTLPLPEDVMQTENTHLTATIMEGNFYLRAESPDDRVLLNVLEDDVQVSISVNQPSNAIVPANQTVFSVSEGDGALLRVSTPFPVNKSVLVKLEVQYENFYPNGDTVPEPWKLSLSIPAGATEVTASLKTDDKVKISDSLIRIVLLYDPAYTFTSQNYVIRLVDEDDASNVPSVSFETMENTSFSVGSEISLVLKANERHRGDPVSIRLGITQTQDFLTMAVPKSVVLGHLKESAKFSLLTKRRVGVEGSGTITVSILPSLPADTYSVNSGGGEVTIQINAAEASPPVVNQPEYSVVSHVMEQVLLQIGETPTDPQPLLADSKKIKGGEDNGTNPNSNAPAVPIISIAATSGAIDEGSTLHLQAKSDIVAKSQLIVNVELSASGRTDLNQQVLVQISQGETNSDFSIFIEDDGIEQVDSTFTAKIAQGVGYVADPNGGGVASVRILDATTKRLTQIRLDNINSANQVAFANLQESSNLRTLNVASSRISQAFNGTAKPLNTAAGLVSLRDSLIPINQNANKGTSGYLNWMRQMSAEVALFPEEGGAELASVWGEGDSHAFAENQLHDRYDLKGSMNTGYLGMDSQFGNDILGGIATSITQADARVSSDGMDELDYQFSGRGIHSYLAWQPMQGTEKLQAIAGMEFGDLKIDQDGYGREEAVTLSYMFAISDSRQLYSSKTMFGGGVFTLNQGNQLIASSSHLTGATDLIESMDRTKFTWRSDLSGSYSTQITEEIGFSPSITAGILGFDSVDESHYDLTLGGKTEIRHAANLIVANQAEIGVSQDSRYNRTALSGALEYAEKSNGQGFQFALNSEWGQLNDNLFASQSEFGQFDFAQSNSSEDSEFRHGVELGYGIEFTENGGILTPYAGLNLQSGNGTKVQLGGRYAANAGFGFDLGAYRNASESGNVSHEINLTGNVNW